MLSQSVAKGKKVARGTAVKLTVSKQKKAEAVVTKKPAATVKPTQRSKKKKKDFEKFIYNYSKIKKYLFFC